MSEDKRVVEFIETLQEKFKTKVQTKNSWGKNELLKEFDDVVMACMMDWMRNK